MADYLRIARAALGPESAASAETAPPLAKIEAQDEREVDHARDVLNSTGARIMALKLGPAIGVWSDLDTPEVRSALRVLRLDQLPLRFLDGPAVQMRYKVRSVPGEPGPLSALKAKECTRTTR
jgi:hypothetical protein